jgi:fatty acid desaturase
MNMPVSADRLGSPGRLDSSGLAGSAPAAVLDAPLDDYRMLAEEMRTAGLLARRPWTYTVKIGVTVLCYAGAWAALFLVGDSWATLGVAVVLALLFTQVVFLGHDAGHQQIFGSRRANRMVGLGVGNLLTGLSFGWWVPKHNAHHAHPNQVNRDPDLGAGIVAFTLAPETAASRGGVSHFLARRQAWLFFPFLMMQGLGLHVTGVQNILRRRGRSAWVEIVLLAVHAILYATAVLWVLAPAKAIAFFFVQQGIFGLYLGCIFAPNHKGMPVIGPDEQVAFARRQIVTARNVSGGRLTTLMFGGLNYQIEHHLFPTMPRFNLAKAQRIVRPFCMKHDLPYRQDSPFNSYREILRHLVAVGRGRDNRTLRPNYVATL